jgi:hypothetical protein
MEQVIRHVAGGLVRAHESAQLCERGLRVEIAYGKKVDFQVPKLLFNQTPLEETDHRRALILAAFQEEAQAHVVSICDFCRHLQADCVHILWLKNGKRQSRTEFLGQNSSRVQLRHDLISVRRPKKKCLV